jgi:hypothetical protein
MLPEDVYKRLNWSNEVKAIREESSRWSTVLPMLFPYPTAQRPHSCTDVITGVKDSTYPSWRNEMHWGVLSAFLAYTLPALWPHVATYLYHTNGYLNLYVSSLMAENAVQFVHDYKRMMRVSTPAPIIMPENTPMAGFYLRTPVRLWNAQQQPVYALPPWKQRHKLLNLFSVGNTSCYVWRHILAASGTQPGAFDLEISFRGTSNEVNGVPQWGKNYHNTQLHYLPTFHPDTNDFYDPSAQLPLFFYYYMYMLDDIWPLLEQCLKWLGLEEVQCRRLVVSGHSMGAALVLCLQYRLYAWNRAWWDKTYFRSVGAPMFCNDHAVKLMEQRVINAHQTDKHLEIINEDDLINVPYQLGGLENLRKALQHGVRDVVQWALQQTFATVAPIRWAQEQGMQHLLRTVQIAPQQALLTFIYGALKEQHTESQLKEAPVRMGQRNSEKRWYQTEALQETYGGTLRVCVCERGVEMEKEYVGKSHNDYIRLQFRTVANVTLQAEKELYEILASRPLTHRHNKVRVVPMFPEVDLRIMAPLIQQWLQSYQPATPPQLRHAQHIIGLQTR